VAWIIEVVSAETPKNFGAKPKQQMNYSSRVRNGPAVCFGRIRAPHFVTDNYLEQECGLALVFY